MDPQQIRKSATNILAVLCAGYLVLFIAIVPFFLFMPNQLRLWIGVSSATLALIGIKKFNVLFLYGYMALTTLDLAVKLHLGWESFFDLTTKILESLFWLALGVLAIRELRATAAAPAVTSK